MIVKNNLYSYCGNSISNLQSKQLEIKLFMTVLMVSLSIINVVLIIFSCTILGVHVQSFLACKIGNAHTLLCAFCVSLFILSIASFLSVKSYISKSVDKLLFSDRDKDTLYHVSCNLLLSTYELIEHNYLYPLIEYFITQYLNLTDSVINLINDLTKYYSDVFRGIFIGCYESDSNFVEYSLEEINQGFYDIISSYNELDYTNISIVNIQIRTILIYILTRFIEHDCYLLTETVVNQVQCNTLQLEKYYR